MSNYRRLISYIYAYEGTVKGKNIGFAKLEARNGQCRISVSVKKVYVGANDLGVYLLSDSQEIFLGRIFIRSGVGEFRTVVRSDNVEESGRSLDDCYGLSVHDVQDRWRSYATVWEDRETGRAEDAVAYAAEVELAGMTSENLMGKKVREALAQIATRDYDVRLRAEGVATGEEADAHLKLLALREKRERYVAGLLEIEPAALTLGGKKAIARWYEVYGYDDAMVQEAAVQAGPKRDLWYWNSILKTWNAKGLRTIRDVRGPAPVAGASRNIRVDRETPSGNDFLQGALDRPRRHKRKD